MLEFQFEALLKVLSGTAGRRAALRALAVSALGGTLASLKGRDVTEEATAKRHQRRHAKGRPRRHRKHAHSQKEPGDHCAKAGQKPKDGKPCCSGLHDDGTGICVLSPGMCDVCASGCTYATVQAAVSDSAGLSSLTVCAGTYPENVIISRDVTLTGAGDGDNPAVDTILNGGAAGSVVTIGAGRKVTLQALRLTNGVADFGGGIRNAGTLTLRGSTVSGNTGTFGGGLYNDHGTLRLSDSHVDGNNGSDSGGGLLNQGGTVELTNCTVSGNNGRFGGGIDTEGPDATLSLADSVVSDNTAVQLGGGIFADGATTVSLSGSVVSGNTANQEGGGIAIDDNVVIMTLTNSHVRGNTGLSGGGIFSVGSVTLSGSTVDGNRALNPGPGDLHGDGGGIFNGIGGDLTLTTSSVTGNVATHEGGGILNAGMLACGDAGTVSGNTAGTAGTENCLDDGGSGCGSCN